MLVVLAAVTIASVIAASMVIPLDAWLGALAGRLQSLGLFGAALFMALYILGGMAFVPASAFSLAAGLIYGPWGMPLAWVSMMTIAAVTFALARGLISTRIYRALLHRPKVAAFAEVIAEQGWRFVLLVRVSGIVPFGVQNCAFGMTRIRLGPYLLATSVGVLPSIFLYAGAGAFGNVAINGGASGPFATAILSGMIVSGVLLVFLTARSVRARLALRQS
jgi:uncharacterized membrane protein YdjX (TVP38/TMEM64 family)